MKMLPSTLAGWIVFYLWLISTSVLVVWVLTREDIPQMVGTVLTGVVSGYLGVLTGKNMNHAPSGEETE